MSDQELHTYWMAASGQEGGDHLPSARFPYWSFTKTAISVCALRLVEAGALSLDTPLVGQSYSLRNLLGHTSGLPDYGTLKDYHAAVARGDVPWSREELLEATFKQGLLFDPGKGWSYSNLGYLFVRDTIEAATAKSLGTVIYEFISKPLGLETIKFWGTLAQSSDLHWDAAAGYDPNWVYHGCLVGSAPDATRLLHALFGDSLLRPETLNIMLKNRTHLGGAIFGRPWKQCGYALGLMSGEMSNAGRAIGHTGGGPFSVNAIYHFPDLPNPVTVATFTHGSDEGVAEFAAARIAQDR